MDKTKNTPLTPDQNKNPTSSPNNDNIFSPGSSAKTLGLTRIGDDSKLKPRCARDERNSKRTPIANLNFTQGLSSVFDETTIEGRIRTVSWTLSTDPNLVEIYKEIVDFFKKTRDKSGEEENEYNIPPWALKPLKLSDFFIPDQKVDYDKLWNIFYFGSHIQDHLRQFSSEGWKVLIFSLCFIKNMTVAQTAFIRSLSDLQIRERYLDPNNNGLIMLILDYFAKANEKLCSPKGKEFKNLKVIQFALMGGCRTYKGVVSAVNQYNRELELEATFDPVLTLVEPPNNICSFSECSEFIQTYTYEYIRLLERFYSSNSSPSKLDCYPNISELNISKDGSSLSSYQTALGTIITAGSGTDEDNKLTQQLFEETLAGLRGAAIGGEDSSNEECASVQEETTQYSTESTQEDHYFGQKTTPSNKTAFNVSNEKSSPNNDNKHAFNFTFKLPQPITHATSEEERRKNVRLFLYSTAIPVHIPISPSEILFVSDVVTSFHYTYQLLGFENLENDNQRWELILSIYLKALNDRHNLSMLYSGQTSVNDQIFEKVQQELKLTRELIETELKQQNNKLETLINHMESLTEKVSDLNVYISELRHHQKTTDLHKDISRGDTAAYYPMNPPPIIPPSTTITLSGLVNTEAVTTQPKIEQKVVDSPTPSKGLPGFTLVNGKWVFEG